MKMTDQIYLKGKFLLIGGIICLLGGFNSCSLGENDLEEAAYAQYGREGALFSVKGEVVTPNNQPLENILVEIPNDINDPQPYQKVEVRYTNKKGVFEWERKALAKDQTFRFIIKDIDGDKNGGHFKNDTVDVKFSLKQLAESGGNGIWEYGSVSENIKIKLSRKE